MYKPQTAIGAINRNLTMKLLAPNYLIRIIGGEFNNAWGRIVLKRSGEVRNYNR